MTDPTKQQIALAKFADDCEAAGFKPSHYWRLMPAIQEARAAIDKKLYDVARDVCHEHGMDWTDPRTGTTHKAPKK